MLRYRPRSCAEARNRLVQYGFSDHEIDNAIEQGKAAGLLDDKLFAKLWVEDRLAHHPLSRRAVERELEEKGIDRETVAQILNELYPPEKEVRIALELAKARIARYRGLSRTTRMWRTLNFLLRRGFNLSLARKAVRTAEKLSDREIE